MKYIDSEKLKRFVRELKERAKRNCCDSWGIVPNALEEVEDFIDSLQQEQLEVDLEKEIRFMWEKCNPTDEGMGVESTYMHIEAFDIIVRYFYELGLNARKEADDYE